MFFGLDILGDNCFIGTRAMVLPGVTIGKNCVIGAGSIVTRDIPPNKLAVGSPAKVIRTIVPSELVWTLSQMVSRSCKCDSKESH